MNRILERILVQVDLVVIDSPPLLAVTDAVVLGRRVDGIVMVVKPGVTRLAAARQVVDQLRRVGAGLLGVVLNEVEIKHSRSAYSHYQGYYTACYDSQERPENSRQPEREARDPV